MKEEYKGFDIEIIHDEAPENPREFEDIFTTMVCWHNRYTLGDENPKCGPDEYKFNRGCVEVSVENNDSIRYLNLYLYDHSGITMNVSGFPCPWDSGQVGFIYMTKKNLRDIGYKIPKSATWKTLVDNPWYREDKKPREILTEGFPNDKKITLEGLAYRFMKNDVKEYDKYISGDVYISRINHPDFDVWFGGNYNFDEALQAAKDEIDCHLKKEG
jgi:hypothetical protein